MNTIGLSLALVYCLTKSQELHVKPEQAKLHNTRR